MGSMRGNSKLLKKYGFFGSFLYFFLFLQELINVLYEKVLKDTAILIVINKMDRVPKENNLEYYIKKFSLKEM